MADIFEMLVLSMCVLFASFIHEVGSQPRKQPQKTPPLTTERIPINDMLGVLQDAMSGNEVSFSALDSISDLLPADLTVEPVAVPFVDNTKVKWSVPQVNKPQTKPTPQPEGNKLQNIISTIAKLGNDNTNLNKLLQASSVVIPLDNLQFMNSGPKLNNDILNANSNKVSKQNDKRLLQASEMHQSPVRRINTVGRLNTVPIKLPTSNSAIYIPTSLLSRIRRQTPKGFLVLPVMSNNQTGSKTTASLQIPNINNSSVLLVVRKSPGTQTNASQSVFKPSPNVQGILNSQAGAPAIRPGSVSPQTGRSVNLNNQPTSNGRNTNLNNQPISSQRLSNQPIRSRATAGNIQSVRNRNRRQGIQPRQIIQQPSISQQGQTVPQSQLSGIISRNRPLVQAVSSRGRFPAAQTSRTSQSLRTGQTGQPVRTGIMSQTLRTGQVFRRPSRPVVQRAQPVRRPARPTDPFSRRFFAGFTRGSTLLQQPPLQNTTFFNADGTRVTVDTDINGNIIRRIVEGPGGEPLGTPMIPQTGLPFGGMGLPGGIGLPGAIPGTFPGPMIGGLRGGFGGFGII